MTIAKTHRIVHSDRIYMIKFIQTIVYPDTVLLQKRWRRSRYKTTAWVQILPLTGTWLTLLTTSIISEKDCAWIWNQGFGLLFRLTFKYSGKDKLLSYLGSLICASGVKIKQKLNYLKEYTAFSNGTFHFRNMKMLQCVNMCKENDESISSWFMKVDWRKEKVIYSYACYRCILVFSDLFQMKNYLLECRWMLVGKLLISIIPSMQKLLTENDCLVSQTPASYSG